MTTPKPRHAAAIWVDNANITRTRVVPSSRHERDADFCVTLTQAIQGMPSMYDAAFESPVGEVYLAPSGSRYDVRRWMNGAFAYFGDMRLNDGATPWNHCPRTFLRRQVRRLRDEFGVTPTVGFELEFQIVDRESLEPIDAALYCSTKAFHDGRAWKLLKEIVECLEDDLGIPVHQYHSESAHGQLEISIGPFGVGVEGGGEAEDVVDSLVRAVDKLVLTRQTIYALTAQAGLQATFVPKLKAGQAGNAAHIHIGLLDASTKSNLFSADTSRASAFLAGVLEELPGLCMLLAPTINSYERLQPQCWAGAYQCYGYENREAPIRLVGPTAARDDMSKVNHFEVKTVDGTANPYVALGSILAAGMSGLVRDLKLPAPCVQDPWTVVECDRPSRLPGSLEEAIDRFEARKAGLWDEVLSGSYADLLVRLRRAELEHYGSLGGEVAVREFVKRY